MQLVTLSRSNAKSNFPNTAYDRFDISDRDIDPEDASS